MALLTLKAFGALDFRNEACESVPAVLAQPKRAALLAYLILAHPGEFCRRDTLLALFWPDLDQEAGRHALNQALSFLRRHLPEGVLVTRGAEEVGVDPARSRSDVGAFQGALASGNWSEALGHYQGELLEGLHVSGAAPFLDWVDRERERLREAAADAAWEWARALVVAGRLSEAERTAQRALHLVPTNESAVRDFIHALAAAGDRAAALRFYEKFAAMLEQELEVEPAPETEAVADEVRNGGIVAAVRPSVEVGTEATAAAGLQVTPTGSTQAGPTPTGTMPPAAAGPWRRRIAVGGAVAGAAAFAMLAYVALRPDPLDVTVSDVQPVTSEPGVEWLAAISPDGRAVAYVARPGAGVTFPRTTHIEIRSTVSGGEGGGVRVEGQGLRSSSRPAWSADGEVLRFLGCTEQGACSWMEVGRMGGAIRAVSLPPGVPAANPDLAWSADDAQVAYFESDTLFVASAEEGVRPVFFLEPSLRNYPARHSIAWSPDGKRIAFVNGAMATQWAVDFDPSSIWVVEVESGQGWELLGGPSFNGSPVWMDERRLLFVSDRDGARAVYVAEVGRPGSTTEHRALPQFSDPRTVSYSAATGRVAFSRLTNERIIRSYPANPDAPVSIGDGIPVITGNRLVWGHDLSPDEKWIVYADDFRGQTDIYKAPVAGGPAVRLTDTPTSEAQPMWSPDGSEISFEAPGAGVTNHQYQIWTIPADGGAATQITASPPDGGSHTYAVWLPGGRYLVFGHVPLGGGYYPDGIWVMEREAPGRPWGEPRRIAEGTGVAYATLNDTTFVLSHPYPPFGPTEYVTVHGTVLWSRDVRAASDVHTWGMGARTGVSPDRRTLYSWGMHEDGRYGLWAVGDRGRGEPRLVIAFDRPELERYWQAEGRDRIYVGVGTTQSDVWVATLRR
ncbi:MAG TPA: BTAD domain-containing putative transcriptional regulator [Longimicrobiales bacterium]|nr:BTAD domain-containing putative transcriptional regulator [Longimicrobiales bacterium]